MKALRSNDTGTEGRLAERMGFPPAPSTDPLYYWKFVLNILEAGGVVGAVVLALWDKLRPLIFRPALRFAFASERSIVEELVAHSKASAADPSSVQHVCDVFLHNDGRAPAWNTALHVKCIERLASAEDRVGAQQPLAAAVAEPWVGRDGTQTTIFADLPARFRFLLVMKQGESAAGAPAQAKAVAQVTCIRGGQIGEPYALTPGHYRFHILAVSDGRYRTSVCLHVHFSGIWMDQAQLLAQGNHLLVRIEPEPSGRWGAR